MINLNKKVIIPVSEGINSNSFSTICKNWQLLDHFLKLKSRQKQKFDGWLAWEENSPEVYKKTSSFLHR